jgi:ABC-type multidrug transport system fused ATPase/permease subunit
VQSADLIVVLEQGRVAQMGTHKDLLAQGGLYARLYEMQFDAPREEEVV